MIHLSSVGKNWPALAKRANHERKPTKCHRSEEKSIVSMFLALLAASKFCLR